MCIQQKEPQKLLYTESGAGNRRCSPRDLSYHAGSQYKDKEATHRSGIEPPWWTCGRTVERRAGRDLLLCPPGKTSSCLI